MEHETHNHDLTLEQQPETDEFKFEIITDPEQREALAWCADRLIEKIVSEKFDCLVFLDQSARPVSWLARERFEFLQNSKQGIFADEKKSAARFPEVKFICFGPKDKENARDRKKKQNMVEELKKMFQKPESKKTYFDNKKTLIIDEYSPAFYEPLPDGKKKLRTVHVAQQVLKEAFHECNAAFFEAVFIPLEKRNLFLTTGGAPWRRVQDTGEYDPAYKGITGVSKINKKKKFMSRPYKQVYPFIKDNLKQRRIGLIEIAVDLIHGSITEEIREHLPILRDIGRKYYSLTQDEQKNAISRIKDELVALKEKRPDMCYEIRGAEDLLRIFVTEPLVENTSAMNYALDMPERTKKLRAEIQKIAEMGL